MDLSRSSPEEELRLISIRSLGSIGPQTADVIPFLRKLLNNDKQPLTVRWQAIWSLGYIGRPAKEAIPDLIKGLAVKELRFCAVEALGRMGPDARAAIPELTKALTDETKAVRKMAAVALERVGR
jgi:HEAT repeat protein